MSLFTFRRYHPLSLRVWHWLNALTILGLLSTVFIRKTLLSWRTNSAVIEAKLSQSGILITPELAKDIAVTIRNPLWDWHIWLGYGLTFLFALRVFIAVFYEKTSPCQLAFRSFKHVRTLPAADQSQGFHFAIVRTGYALFYLITLFMIVSGLLLVFKNESGFTKETLEILKECHEFLMWFFVGFVGLHIGGVIFSELKSTPGIVSDMIHGGKNNPLN